MYVVSDEEFQDMVEAAVAKIPERFAEKLANVAFKVADEPSWTQLREGGIRPGRGTLLGLYTGIPLPARSGVYSGVVPDVITIFKRPHERVSRDAAHMAEAVHQTVWHEVAHYFGLDHRMIRDLEG
jgi:predicted Zn-dependent protease with MMP-like domain